MFYINKIVLKQFNFLPVRIVSLLLTGIVLTVMGGCTKFVKVETPKSQLLGEFVFEESGTALAALAGLYTQLRDGDDGLLSGSRTGMNIYMGYYSDELVCYDNRGITAGERFYGNTLFADAYEIAAIWSTSYKQIYYANAIIEGIEKSILLKDAERSQVKGEALVVRALLHFYLLNLFGNVPYVNSTDYLLNNKLPRMDSAAVYKNIIADLETAEQLLSENYPSAERVRPNKSVAKAILSRVFLYTHQWQKAEALATSVIENAAYMWVDDLSKVFLKESSATIWAFKPVVEGYNTIQGETFILNASPIPSAFSLSQSFLDAIEPGDLRRSEWIGSFSQGTNTWYYSYKYKIRGTEGTGVTVEYPILLRLEEQYLIRAEARAQQENITGAQEDLNKLRARAGLLDTDADTKPALLDAILKERRVELFTEYGHRWFDLKRMGKLDAVLGAVKPNWDPEDKLLPIPEKELLVNPNLNPQNLGY